MVAHRKANSYLVDYTGMRASLGARLHARKCAIENSMFSQEKRKVKRMSHTESAIHYVMKAHGKWREAAPGQE
jgi:hypothetical protein